MDALDRLAGPASDLLSIVDETLVGSGAPANHPLWPLLRRLGALPGDAVRAVADLRPAPIAAAGAALRALSQEYDQLPAPSGDWQGPAAEAFTGRWTALAEHLSGSAVRLGETATCAGAVADWAHRTRRALARTLAVVLSSREAVTLVTGAEPADAARAAADVAACVLRTIAGAYDEAEGLLSAWAGRLDELPFHQPEAGVITRDAIVVRE